MPDSEKTRARPAAALDAAGRARRAGELLMALPPWAKYLFALAITGATFLARLSLGFAASDYLMLVIYTIPIILSAYLGGLGPGLFSTAVATGAAKYFFIPYHHSFAFNSHQTLLAWSCLFVSGIVISSITESLHRTRKNLEIDIAERKQAEQALRASEDRLRIISDNTYDWEYWRAPEGKYLWISPSCERITGYTPEELMDDGAHKILRIIHPDDRRLWEEHLREVDSHHPEHRELDFRIVKPTGELAWISHICKPIHGRGGAFLGRRGCNHEITERKRAEEHLKLAMRQATAANKAKSEFLANMSHEIRTPLNGIMGVLQIIETDSLDEKQKAFLAIAKKSSDRLTRLLSDILDFSLIEADKFFLYETNFSVDNLQETILDLFAATATEKNIHFDFLIDERIPSILTGDEHRLIQILFNIVGNAIKFTKDGSVHAGAYLLQYKRNNTIRILFTVTDTGIGISNEQMENIFDPFIQGDDLKTKRFQGAGLGLSIVRKLVKMMGGELCIDSSEEEGTTVCVSLPFKVPGPLQGLVDQTKQTADAGQEMLAHPFC